MRRHCICLETPNLKTGELPSVRPRNQTLFVSCYDPLGKPGPASLVFSAWYHFRGNSASWRPAEGDRNWCKVPGNPESPGKLLQKDHLVSSHVDISLFTVNNGGFKFCSFRDRTTRFNPCWASFLGFFLISTENEHLPCYSYHRSKLSPRSFFSCCILLTQGCQSHCLTKCLHFFFLNHQHQPACLSACAAQISTLQVSIN